MRPLAPLDAAARSPYRSFMRAARRCVGKRDAYSFSLSDDGLFRMHLRVGAADLDLVVLGDLDPPWDAAPRSSVRRRPGRLRRGTGRALAP